MNREVALRNLEEVNEVLSALRVTYWLDCGTLLGCIREDDLLTHDEDVDLGIWQGNHEAIAEGLFARGFAKWRFFGTPEHGYEQSFIRDGVKVDLFYFYPDRDNVWQGSWDGRTLLRSVFPRDAVLPPKRHTFQGIDTHIPNQPEAMLEARYGDWREVVTDWDWTTDPLCIIKEATMAEQTFKLTAPNGQVVEVTGAARRDELVNNRGYTEGAPKKTTAKKTTRKK